nr:magnesium protoporphyrin IX methyltransferase [Oceanococcus sp. HetDA_MAG_MS8]
MSAAPPSAPSAYLQRRGLLEDYFDRTAADAWAKLTSDAPVSGIRATVRAGRDQMRNHLLSNLPQDMQGQRLLDAGCGTGMLAIEAAQRGAHVVAIDLSPTLVQLAEERTPKGLAGRIDYAAGDMLDPQWGQFHYVVAMDSLIHYQRLDMARMVAQLAQRADIGLQFTFAPRTVLLSIMHAVGRLFPRANRAPMIEPVTPQALRKTLAEQPELANWIARDSLRVHSSFYISEALELVHA